MVANVGSDLAQGVTLCNRMDKGNWNDHPRKRLPNCRFIQRWNSFPIYQQRLLDPRLVSGQTPPRPHPPPAHQGPVGWAKQSGQQTTPRSLPQLQRQMTVGGIQARNRPQQRMDMSFFGDTFSSPQFDHSLTGDLGSFDTSVFASSPNSLYMYDLEKTDMQSSFGNTGVGNVSKTFFSDDFELKDTYETSQDICSVLDDPQGSEVSSIMANDGQTWDDVKTLSSSINPSSDDVFKGLDNPSSVTGPTLAELNSQPFDDSSKSFLSSVSMTVLKTPTTHTVTSSGDAVNTWTSSVETILKPSNQQSVNSNIHSDWSLVSDQGGFSNLQMKQTIGNKPIISTVVNPQNVTRIKTEVPETTSCTVGDATIKSFLTAKKLSTSSPSKSVMSSTGNQLQAVKRRSPPSTVSFDPALNQKWEEIRHFVFDAEETPSKPKIKRESIESVSSVVTSVEDSDSDINSSDEDNDYSDSDSDASQETWSTKQTRDSVRKKEKQYFWQYNIQSKGPKGTRMNFDLDPKNPHILKDFEDPVFDPVAGSKIGLGSSIRHGGKARKGDGNDVSPNPKKLYQIGIQLKKLNKQINTFAPLCDMPVSSRNKSKKEKNKLASRACRLKKKAQHEAFKVKLYGLEMEHKQLMNVMRSIRGKLREAVACSKENRQTTLAADLDALIKDNLTEMVAGNTTDFVNKVVQKVEDGDTTGGLGLGT